MTNVEIFLLGQVEARVGGQPVPLGPPRQRAVFAVLAANANRTVTRDYLLDAVWGEELPDSAANNLNTYMSGLRRALGPEAGLLATVPGGYELRTPDESIDVRVATRLRDAGRQHTRAGELPLTISALDEALSLWSGEPYAGVPGPFAQRERQRLIELRLGMLEDRAHVAIDLGRSADVLGDLTVLISAHPLRETLHLLLMRALAAEGRVAEALEVYRNARTLLAEELGIEPGPALQNLHRQLLKGGDQVPNPPVVQLVSTLPPLVTMPAHVATGASAGGPLCGRDAQRAVLERLISEVAAGHGAAVWIEGEPGIGKSQLLTAAFAGVAELGCQIAWAVADELSKRMPLQVLTEAFGLETTSTHPRLAALAGQLLEQSGRPDGDGPSVAADGLVQFVREACRTAPLILIVDDLHWADEASLHLWGRFAVLTRRLPLLMVAATRQDGAGPELNALRRALETGGGHLLTLDSLDASEVDTIMTGMVGSPPGAALRDLVAQAAGNPLYVREIVTALLRDKKVTVVDGRAEIDAAADHAPDSLLSAVRRTLDMLSDSTRELLSLAALLGTEFSATEVAALAGIPLLSLVRAFQEATEAGVVIESGTQLTFRHPCLREALYDAIARPLRPALRRQAAEALSGSGSPLTRIAEQLGAEPAVIDTWVVAWLIGNYPSLAKRAPDVVLDLLHRALDSDVPTADQRQTLLVEAVWLEQRLGGHPEDQARQALAGARDAAEQAEMRQLVAAIAVRRGDAATAVSLLSTALADPDLAEPWRTRHRVLLAQVRRGDLSDLDRADRDAVEQIESGDGYEVAFGLQTRWLVASIRRDHAAALGYIDRAIEVARGDEHAARLMPDLLDNRVFSLHNLDRLDEAETTLAAAAALESEDGRLTALSVARVIHHYWLGRWDEALTEIAQVTDDDPVISFDGTREPAALALLLHGVAALIAARRGELASALRHLERAGTELPATPAERESCDFLLCARAIVYGQQGRPADALAAMAPLWEPSFAPMMLRHQWLPAAMGLALRIGDDDVVRQVSAICAHEAAQERTPARAWAADAVVRALLTGDPKPAMAAAQHYAQVGRLPERATALEEASRLLTRAGRTREAAAALAEAIELFERLGATWNLELARAPFGLVRVGRHETAHGVAGAGSAVA